MQRPHRLWQQRRGHFRHRHQVIELAQQAQLGPLTYWIVRGNKDIGTVAMRDRGLQLVGEAAVGNLDGLDLDRLGFGGLGLVVGLDDLL